MNNKLDNQNGIEFEDDGFDELGNPIDENAQPGIDPTTASDELTDANITQEQIDEMMMLCIPKPDKVSWERWQRVKDLKFRHEHVINLAAAGMNQKTISEITGYGLPQISKLLRNPEYKEKINKGVMEIYGEDHKKAVKGLVSKAMIAMDDAVSSGSEKIRHDAAKYILDHSIGKAEVTITETRTSLSEVIITIDKMRSDQLRDVGSNPNLLPKSIDPFDTIIEQVIPKGMVIGKRSNSEGQA